MGEDVRPDQPRSPERPRRRAPMSRAARARLQAAVANRADDPDFQRKLDLARNELTKLGR